MHEDKCVQKTKNEGKLIFESASSHGRFELKDISLEKGSSAQRCQLDSFSVCSLLHCAMWIMDIKT